MVETLHAVLRWCWKRLSGSLRLDKRLEFSLGDVGLRGNVQVRDAANGVDAGIFRRFGGSTSPTFQWPDSDATFGNEEDIDIAYFGGRGGGRDSFGARRWEVRPAGEAAPRRGKSHLFGRPSFLLFCCVLVLAAGLCVLLSLLDVTIPSAFVDSSFLCHFD